VLCATLCFLVNIFFTKENIMATMSIRDRAGKAISEVEYTPIRVVVAGKQHDLALHLLGAAWQVSEPISGARVCNVHGFYRGIRVTSKHLGKREAKTLAIAQVLARAEQIGAERFNAVLATAKAA
jgi:hypothetical protein